MISPAELDGGVHGATLPKSCTRYYFFERLIAFSTQHHAFVGETGDKYQHSLDRQVVTVAAAAAGLTGTLTTVLSATGVEIQVSTIDVEVASTE